MKGIYSTKIEHTRATLTRLFKTQYYTFDKVRIAVRFAVGILLVLAAVMLSLPVWARVILLIPGTWLAVSTDFPAQVQADRVISARKGKLPVMSYEFFEDCMKIQGEGSMSIPYKSFAVLIHDDDYCYLIISRESICMMGKPENWDEFMRFLHKKTGLVWQKNKSLLALNISDIKEIFAARSK